MRIAYRNAYWLILAVALAGCESSSDTPTEDAGVNDSSTTDTPTTREDAAHQDTATEDTATEDSSMQDRSDPPDTTPTDAENPDDGGETSCVNVTSFSGVVHDSAKKPLEGVSAVVCLVQNGIPNCERAVLTGPDGKFNVDTSKCVQRAAYHLNHLTNLKLAPLYCPYKLGAGGAITSPKPDILVEAPSCTRTPHGDPTKEHTITASSGSEVRLIPENIIPNAMEADYTKFELLVWDKDKYGWPCFIDDAHAPEELIAFAPELETPPGTFANNSLHVAFKNTKKLAAGTKVDIYMLGAATTKTHDGRQIHEGIWEKACIGIVDSAGKFIVSEKDKGLPGGTWIGWRKQSE